MRIPSPACRVLSLSLLAFALPGCSGGTKPPTLEVVGVRVLERSDAATLLALDLTATNPNPDPLPLRDVVYQVRINDAEPFAGTRLAERTIPRYATQSLTLPVVAPPAIDPATFTSAGSIVYLKPSVLSQTLLDIRFVTPTQGFAGDGRVTP